MINRIGYYPTGLKMAACVQQCNQLTINDHSASTMSSMRVPRLSQLSCSMAVHSVLGHCNSLDASRALALLRTDYFSPVSLQVLNRVVADHPRELTDALLVCLAPPHVINLSLKGCTQISHYGISCLLNR